MTSAIDNQADDPNLRPICGRARFTELVEALVADFTPQMFAVVQEYGDCLDADIVAWGIAFENRVEVIDVSGGLRMSLQSPERALQAFQTDGDFTTHLVWASPEPNTQRP
ncbi:hypothetical protein [Saccharopolyspora sp. NPDC049426]|uniref:hypothetical protein n=1 Tax=Saccharopolyspora sp. NPDC049426 TaxID=3155652 RepID=UPI00341F18A6